MTTKPISKNAAVALCPAAACRSHESHSDLREEVGDEKDEEVCNSRWCQIALHVALRVKSSMEVLVSTRGFFLISHL